MRRIIMLLFAALLFFQSSYAGETGSAGPVVLVERQAGEIKVVMYMTSW